jgi:hypothetical protein
MDTGSPGSHRWFVARFSGNQIAQRNQAHGMVKLYYPWPWLKPASL